MSCYLSFIFSLPTTSQGMRIWDAITFSCPRSPPCARTEQFRYSRPLSLNLYIPQPATTWHLLPFPILFRVAHVLVSYWSEVHDNLTVLFTVGWKKKSKMAEFVQGNLEDMLTEVEQMARVNLFSTAETRWVGRRGRSVSIAETGTRWSVGRVHSSSQPSCSSAGLDHIFKWSVGGDVCSLFSSEQPWKDLLVAKRRIQLEKNKD